LYAVLEREADNCGCGLAWGGRVDVLYGEDYAFTQAAGLETHQDFANHWNCESGCGGIGGTARLGLALPQAYAEVAWNRLRVKLGHFYTPIGYETVPATGNFFYSHSFTHQYGEPFTHTGALASWQASDRWTLLGGVVNGWDKFDAVTDRAAFLAGATYKPWHQRYTLSAAMITGLEDGSAPPLMGNRSMYSVVFDWHVTDRLEVVLQHDYGIQQAGGIGGRDAEWYSIYQYAYYTLCEGARVGSRIGWFNDDDGSRIFPGIPGHMFEATAGVNVQLGRNIRFRPEVRWNWFDEHAGIPAGIGPFSGNGPNGIFGNFFNLDSQLLAAADLVIEW
jgi:hypothetical protein